MSAAVLDGTDARTLLCFGLLISLGLCFVSRRLKHALSVPPHPLPTTTPPRSGSEKDVYTLVAKAFTRTMTRPEQTPQRKVLLFPQKNTRKQRQKPMMDGGHR